MMRILKKINRTVGDKQYYKYLIPVPKEIIEDMGWSELTNVDFRIKGKMLIIERE